MGTVADAVSQPDASRCPAFTPPSTYAQIAAQAQPGCGYPTAAAAAPTAPTASTPTAAAEESLLGCQVKDDELDDLLDRHNDACPVWVGSHHTGSDQYLPKTESMEYNIPTALESAVSPRGDLYFVVTVTVTYDARYAWSERMVPGVVAFRTDDGSVAWRTYHTGAAHEPQGIPTGLAVSPDGHAVYLTGNMMVPDRSDGHPVVLALNAATGEPLWETHPVTTTSWADDITVSNDGGVVAITGVNLDPAAWRNPMFTVTLDADSGEPQWRHSAVDGRWGLWVIPAPETPSEPDQPAFYVAGSDVWNNLLTVAYGPSGDQLWSHTRPRPPVQNVLYRNVGPGYLAVTPDGRRLVYNARIIGDEDTPGALTVVAVDTATGQQAWEQVYSDGDDGFGDVGHLVMDPSGETVYVNFANRKQPAPADTVAYRVSDGKQIWATQLTGHDSREEVHPFRAVWFPLIAVNPVKRQVYVAVSHFDINGLPNEQVWAAVATYDADTGKQLALSRYGDWTQQTVPVRAVRQRDAFSYGIAVNADGSRLFMPTRTDAYLSRYTNTVERRRFTQVVAYDTPG